jgi:hypothetical protein
MIWVQREPKISGRRRERSSEPVELRKSSANRSAASGGARVHAATEPPLSPVLDAVADPYVRRPAGW